MVYSFPSSMASFFNKLKGSLEMAGRLCSGYNPFCRVITGTGTAMMKQQQRSVIYFTHSKGKFRSNRAVLRRFYRLNWGAWIRPRAGRHKHLWRKPYYIRWWAKQHVFCTEEQNKVLDQMVSAQYKQPLYFVDDPYEPYQRRNNFVFVPLGKQRVSKSYIHANGDEYNNQ